MDTDEGPKFKLKLSGGILLLVWGALLAISLILIFNFDTWGKNFPSIYLSTFFISMPCGIVGASLLYSAFTFKGKGLMSLAIMAFLETISIIIVVNNTSSISLQVILSVLLFLIWSFIFLVPGVYWLIFEQKPSRFVGWTCGQGCLAVVLLATFTGIYAYMSHQSFEMAFVSQFWTLFLISLIVSSVVIIIELIQYYGHF